MSNSNFPRRAVDEAIDRAVRDLMQIDPRPGLRRRVLARIEKRSLGPWARRSLGPWVLLPASAVLAILLAVVFLRSGDAPLDLTQAPGPSAPSALPAPSAPSARSENPVSAPFAGAVRRSQRDVAIATFDPRRDRITATNLRSPITANEEPADGTLDALHTIRALPTETVAPAPLALPALEIQPLQLQALAPRR